MIAFGAMSTQAKAKAISFGNGVRPKLQENGSEKQQHASLKLAGGVSLRPVVGEERLAQPKSIPGQSQRPRELDHGPRIAPMRTSIFPQVPGDAYSWAPSDPRPGRST